MGVLLPFALQQETRQLLVQVIAADEQAARAAATAAVTRPKGTEEVEDIDTSGGSGTAQPWEPGNQCACEVGRWHGPMVALFRIQVFWVYCAMHALGRLLLICCIHNFAAAAVAAAPPCR